MSYPHGYTLAHGLTNEHGITTLHGITTEHGSLGSTSGQFGPYARGTLITPAYFLSKAWTTDTTIASVSGPYMIAPIEPGRSIGIPLWSNTNRSPAYDYRYDVYGEGNTHSAWPTTALNNAFQPNGGNRVRVRGCNTNGWKFSWVKVTSELMIEGCTGDYAATYDQDGIVVGGNSPANLTASISGNEMIVTARAAIIDGITGDVMIGSVLSDTGSKVLSGTKVFDYGKAVVTADIAGTTLTVTAHSGNTLCPGMQIEMDGGVVVGTISAGTGTTGAYTISNAGGVALTGARLFIRSTALLGSYVVNTFHVTPTGSITIKNTPPAPKASRVWNRITNTHGTDLTHWTVGGVAGGRIENQAVVTALATTGVGNQILVTLAGDPAGGAMPVGASWVGKDVKIARTDIAGTWNKLKDFNRDYTIVSVARNGAGGQLTLTPKDSVNFPVHPTSAGVLNTPIFVVMGTSKTKAAETQSDYGEHADGIGQIDKSRLISACIDDLNTSTGNYQPGGIGANSTTSDCILDNRRNNYKWAVGLTDYEDRGSNIIWIGMQLNPVNNLKRIFSTWIDTTAKEAVTPVNAPFPGGNTNGGMTTTVGIVTGTDGVGSFMAYDSAIYMGGYYFGSPAADLCPVSRGSGFGFTTVGNGYSYDGQRNPSASELINCTFINDVGTVLSNANIMTHIGDIKLTLSSNFPGALADGSPCIVDLTSNQPFVGIGSDYAGARLVRGRQAVPVGVNTFTITATVRGTAISQTFGPFSLTGVSAGTSTLTVTAQTTPAAQATTASSYTFLTQPVGSVGYDIFIAVELHSSAGTPRVVNSVTVNGVAMTAITNAGVTKSSANSVRTEFFRLKNGPGGSQSVVVTGSGSCSGCAIYVWSASGVGVVYDQITGSGSAANIPADISIATPANGALLAATSYASAATGVDRRGTAMTLTGTSAVTQRVTGTITGADFQFTNGSTNLGVELLDQQVNATGTGASAMAAIALGPLT